MKRWLVALLILVLTVVALSQEVYDHEAQIDPKTYRCADHIQLIEAEDGRADVRVVWAHGYHSALHGLDTNGPPITGKAVEEFAKRLENGCREHPDQLFLSAIREMK